MVFPAILFAGVGLMVLWVIAISVPWGGSTSSSTIPDEFRTPLGCDTREEYGFCQEQRAVFKACDYSIPSTAQHTFGRDPYNGGSMTTWTDKGEPVATTTIDVRAQTMTLRSAYCEVVLPLGEYLDLDEAGGEEKLPPQLR